MAHERRPVPLSRVEAIDLSPMTFGRIDWWGRRLAIDPPLTIRPEMGESGELYVLIHDELGVHVFAQTREEVADELAEQLLFLWDAYAQERPERLAPGALTLRDALLRRIQEIGRASQPEGR